MVSTVLNVRVGILTSGGDCPGLNAALWGASEALLSLGVEPVGVRDGFEGLLRRTPGDDSDVPLSKVDWVREVREGGTLLGSTRCHPHKNHEMVQRVSEAVKDLDALLVVGGDGSLRSAAKLRARLKKMGHELVLGCIPKTIDNDVAATEESIGFASAVQRAVDACDAAQSTARSHHRTMVVEVMGRHSGAIAAAVALAGSAQRCVIPEHVLDTASLVSWARSNPGSVIVIAEGAHVSGGPAHAYDAEGWILPGFPSSLVTTALTEEGIPARAVVLGHVLRGGIPVARDRELATSFGVRAALDVAAGKSSMAVLRSGHVETIAVENATLPASPLHDTVVERLSRLGLC